MSCARDKEKWGTPLNLTLLKIESGVAWVKPHLSPGLSKSHFTHLQNGSSIFHPVLSDVEITEANTHADLARCTLSRTWPAEKG